MVYLPVLFSKLGHLLNIFADLANIDIFFWFLRNINHKKNKVIENCPWLWTRWNKMNHLKPGKLTCFDHNFDDRKFNINNNFSFCKLIFLIGIIISLIDWICWLDHNKEMKITVLWTVSIIAKITLFVSIWKLRCKTTRQTGYRYYFFGTYKVYLNYI